MPSRSISARTVVLACGAVVLLVAAVVVLLTLFGTPPAKPGSLPAAPPTNSGKPVTLPTDEGYIAPRLSDSQAEQVKRGETVTLDAPGGGTIQIGPPPTTGGKK